MSFQVKVEYSQDKFINFFVDVVSVYSGTYTFVNLVDDITSRCPSLSYLDPFTIRIRYEDDEGSLINLQYGDNNGYIDMWNNAMSVADRDYKRLKLKAAEIDSPAGRYPSTQNKVLRSSESSDAEHPPSKKKLILSSPAASNWNFEEQKNESKSPETSVKTPLERLFEKLESDIQKTTQNIEAKRGELNDMEKWLTDAKDNNSGSLQVCGQCHLREGHTKRNCGLGQCLSAKFCGLIEKHPDEKGKKGSWKVIFHLSSLV